MKRPCARPGCANLVERGYCAACVKQSPQAFGERQRGSAASRGYGRRWQKARAGWLMAHPVCVDPDGLHVGVVKLATDVDHIQPHRGNQALFWDSANWQSLCHACHSAKTAREDGGFGRRAGRAA